MDFNSVGHYDSLHSMLPTDAVSHPGNKIIHLSTEEAEDLGPTLTRTFFFVSVR